MKIGILTCGEFNSGLVDKYGRSSSLFENMLRPAAPDFKFQRFHVFDDEFPKAPTQCDGWLISGSRHGVYDDLPWMRRLKPFLRAAVKAGVPVAGVCFGHQILAEALGGRVAKSDKGWGVGVHEYAVLRRPGWMAGASDMLRIYAMHQDQVIALPEGAHVLARSAFCEYAMLAYGDPEAPAAISIQPHPEFGPDLAGDLVRAHRGDGIPEPVAAAALATIGSQVHSADFAVWAATYFRQAAQRRRAS